MAGNFRHDIDGLRAIAVSLVVAFHAGVPGLHGGFIGVDVFFVISGFLITRKLTADLAEQGSIDLLGFWLGRAKRLLPAASAMITATLGAQFLIRNPLHWRAAINEAWAAAFYFSNEAVARTDAGYFDDTRVERALLHTWSLSVEEQFYLVWPLLLTVLVGARLRRTRLLVAGLAIGSIAVSAVLTAADSPFAYLSAASRAWEFLAGAALGLPGAVAAARRRLAGVAHSLAIAGTASIIFSATVLTESNAFPFPTAVVPVAGTAMIIAACIDASSPLGTILAWRPMQQIGKLSYSWYLWHWPILVLGAELLDVDHLAARIGLAWFSLIPAFLSYKLIESPVRRLKTTTVSGAALAGLVVPSLVVIGPLLLADSRDNTEFSPPEALALRDAKDDWPEQFKACSLPIVDMLETNCVAGDAASDVTVLLLGDSHAAQWFPALDLAGRAEGFELVALHQGNCPATVLRDSEELLDPCRRVINELDRVLDHFDPAVVVVAHSDSYAANEPLAWETGLATFARELEAEDRTMLVVHDVPRFPYDPTLCLADSDPTTVAADDTCAVSRAEIDERAKLVRAAEHSVIDSYSNVFGWDPIRYLCSTAVCPPRIEGEVVYIDSHHITVSFARSLASYLEAPLAEAIAASDNNDP